MRGGTKVYRKLVLLNNPLLLILKCGVKKYVLQGFGGEYFPHNASKGKVQSEKKTDLQMLKDINLLSLAEDPS